MTDPPILCVLVHHADGREVWTPKAEYETKPDRGSYVINEHKLSPNPLRPLWRKKAKQ